MPPVYSSAPPIEEVLGSVVGTREQVLAALLIEDSWRALLQKRKALRATGSAPHPPVQLASSLAAAPASTDGEAAVDPFTVVDLDTGRVMSIEEVLSLYETTGPRVSAFESGWQQQHVRLSRQMNDASAPHTSAAASPTAGALTPWSDFRPAGECRAVVEAADGSSSPGWEARGWYAVRRAVGLGEGESSGGSLSKERVGGRGGHVRASFAEVVQYATSVGMPTSPALMAQMAQMPSIAQLPSMSSLGVTHSLGGSSSSNAPNPAMVRTWARRTAVNGHALEPLMCGPLLKRGKTLHQWKLRWYTLSVDGEVCPPHLRRASNAMAFCHRSTWLNQIPAVHLQCQAFARGASASACLSLCGLSDSVLHSSRTRAAHMLPSEEGLRRPARAHVQRHDRHAARTDAPARTPRGRDDRIGGVRLSA